MAERLLVVKFGGTSVGSPEALDRSLDIVARTRQEWPRQIVVLSAMSGVTDLLLESAHQAARGSTRELTDAASTMRDRHRQALAGLVGSAAVGETMQEIDRLIEECSAICRAIAVLREASPRALDAVASYGERMVVRLFSAALTARGCEAAAVDSTGLIVTDEGFQAAHPDMEASRLRAERTLTPILDEGRTPVVTGFLGATPDGVTTTLGRGGSDYSAAILGTVLEADEVWIWTDVDGVMTADPKLVPAAVTIPELSYLEMSELAYFGAKVLHPKTIRPVVEAGIVLRIRNTFQAEHPGTSIVVESDRSGSGHIRAVTAISRQGMVTIEGRGMLGVPGVAARAFQAVAATGTSVILITQASSEQSICFTVPAESVRRVIKSLEAVFGQELAQRDIDRIWVLEPVVIVTVVGAGLRNTPGIAGRIFSALGRSGVNVIAIAQGSSEVAISLVVDEKDAVVGVKAIHDLILDQEESNG